MAVFGRLKRRFKQNVRTFVRIDVYIHATRVAEERIQIGSAVTVSAFANVRVLSNPTNRFKKAGRGKTTS